MSSVGLLGPRRWPGQCYNPSVFQAFPRETMPTPPPQNPVKPGQAGGPDLRSPSAKSDILELASWREWPRWRKLAAALVLGAFVVLGAMAGLLLAYMQDLPMLPGPDNLSASLATKIYDINGQLITQLSTENRTIIHLDQTPPNLVNALIALEDRHFCTHWGIDPEGILRAAVVDLKTGHLTEGASTLTQQLAKNLFLTRERSFSRKIKEMLFAFQIERHFTKQEILEMYLNQVYFGNGAYGVEAAARTYFGKHASELTLSECAM